MRLKFLALLMVTVCALVSTAAKADELDDILKRKKIMIAVQTDLPPYDTLDANNQPVGYDIDVAKRIASDLGVELEMVIVSGANRIPSLVSGKVDMVVATLSPTPQRAQVIGLSSPYLAYSQYIIAPSAKSVKSIDDLKDLRVGVTRGTLQDDQITRRAPKGTQIMRFEDDSSTAQALLSGQIDASAWGKSINDDIIKNNPGSKLENKFALNSLSGSIAVRRGEPDLLRWINTWIFVHKQDGWLSDTHKKWVGEDLPTLPVF